MSTFILGGVVGGALILGGERLSIQKTTESERALAEVFYEEAQKYPKECRLSHVTHVMRELASGKILPQKEEERDRILMNFAAEQAERNAVQNLEKAEEYLSLLVKQQNIQTVVEGKVYVEVLEKGMGDPITSTDIVSLYFKQYDKEGALIKDSGEEKPFSIPLSRMIRGFKLGMAGCKIGEKRKIYVHPEYGFGKLGRGQETNQLLIYEVRLVGKIT